MRKQWQEDSAPNQRSASHTIFSSLERTVKLLIFMYRRVIRDLINGSSVLRERGGDEKRKHADKAF